tara:strand:- start:27 stop:230 length:204 start_codon:yes stop_codon:yes gene_type:complete
MEAGDIILYTPDEGSTERPDVGVVLKLSPSATKASVLWSSETVGIYFAVGDLERYPNNFQLLKAQGE